MRMMIATLALLIASSAEAAPLTVHTGESWIFAVKNGEPADVHKVSGTAKPAKSQVMVSVRAMLGMAMIATNNSQISYTFNAELLQGGKSTAARACTLPGGARPIFEQWEQKADAVRISNFRATGTEGRC